MLAYRFGDSVPWSDATYTPHRDPQAAVPPGDDQSPLLLKVVLVDATTGIVRALRTLTWPPGFAATVRGTLTRLLSASFNAATADRELAAIYQRHPSVQSLVDHADATCVGGAPHPQPLESPPPPVVTPPAGRPKPSGSSTNSSGHTSSVEGPTTGRCPKTCCRGIATRATRDTASRSPSPRPTSRAEMRPTSSPRVPSRPSSPQAGSCVTATSWWISRTTTGWDWSSMNPTRSSSRGTRAIRRAVSIRVRRRQSFTFPKSMWVRDARGRMTGSTALTGRILPSDDRHRYVYPVWWGDSVTHSRPTAEVASEQLPRIAAEASAAWDLAGQSPARTLVLGLVVALVGGLARLSIKLFGGIAELLIDILRHLARRRFPELTTTTKREPEKPGSPNAPP